MGYIPEDQVNRLKDTLDIVDIVSGYVDLKVSGQNLKGLCPFHNEKTPSFMVSRERNSFHCFGCGERGDAISFIMKLENLEYVEALKFLADKIGMTLEEEQGNTVNTDYRNKLYKINSLVAKYYLRNMLIDERPQQYIKRRGMDIGMVNTFFLGYAKRLGGLYEFLRENNVDVEDMIKLGFVAKDKDGNGYYDKYRDRLIFPILNNKKKVIGFGARTLGDSKIKYLNSPESEIFIKGDNVYGVDVVQKKYNRERIILVEGYMDVIGLNNQGIDYAMASLGTALTENQAKLVKRYGQQVYIAYDSDEAGIKATLRAIEVFDNLKIDPLIVEFPDSMDPDEYVLKYGKESFEKLLQNAKKSMDYKLDRIYSKNKDRIDVSKDLIDFLANIKGNAIRELYTQKVANSIGTSYDALLNDVVKYREENYKKITNSQTKETYKKDISNVGYNNNYKTTQNVPKEAKRVLLEKEIIGLSLINKTFFTLLNDISKDFITVDYLIDLYDLISKEYAKTDSHLTATFQSELYKKSNVEQNYKKLLSTFIEGTETSVSSELIERAKRFILIERREEINKLLQEASGKPEANTLDLLRELVQLQQELN